MGGSLHSAILTIYEKEGSRGTRVEYIPRITGRGYKETRGDVRKSERGNGSKKGRETEREQKNGGMDKAGFFYPPNIPFVIPPLSFCVPIFLFPLLSAALPSRLSLFLYPRTLYCVCPSRHSSSIFTSPHLPRKVRRLVAPEYIYRIPPIPISNRVKRSLRLH